MRSLLRSPRALVLVALVLVLAVAGATVALLVSGHSDKHYSTGRIGGSGDIPDPLSTGTKKLPHVLTPTEATGAVAPANSVFTVFLSRTDPATAQTAWSYVSGLGDTFNGLKQSTYKPTANVSAVGYSATPSPKIAAGTIEPNDYPFVSTLWLVTDSTAHAKAELKKFDKAKTPSREPLFATVHGTVVVVSASEAEQKLATTSKTLGTTQVWQNSRDAAASRGALWMSPYRFGSSVVDLAAKLKQGPAITKYLSAYLASNFGPTRTWTASLTKLTATRSMWKGTWKGGSLPTAPQIQAAQTSVTTDPIANNDGGGGKGSGGAVTCKQDPCVTFGQGGDLVQVLFQSSSNVNSGIGGKTIGPDGKRVGPHSQWIAFLANDMLAGVANGNAEQVISPAALHAELNPDHSLLVTIDNVYG